jgi:hypothetical protein
MRILLFGDIPGKWTFIALFCFIFQSTVSLIKENPQDCKGKLPCAKEQLNPRGCPESREWAEFELKELGVKMKRGNRKTTLRGAGDFIRLLGRAGSEPPTREEISQGSTWAPGELGKFPGSWKPSLSINYFMDVIHRHRLPQLTTCTLPHWVQFSRTFLSGEGAHNGPFCNLCPPEFFNPWQGQNACFRCGSEATQPEEGKDTCICRGLGRVFQVCPLAVGP